MHPDVMFSPENRERWLKIAETLKPTLHAEPRYPVALVEGRRNPAAYQGWELLPSDSLSEFESRILKPGDSFILDFGQHVVGHFHFDISSVGSLGEPVRLQLMFGEVPAEVCEPFEPFHSTLSRAWLQDEVINLDALPQTVRLPRRYSFRYVKITVVNAGSISSYRVRFGSFECQTVTSADYSRVPDLPPGASEEMRTLDEVSLRTLANCMQTVFEDGPKRDRRLWVGDLRLEALANYVSFRNDDLVKRCLYLLAGLALEDGMVAACVYETLHSGDKILDYAALYVSTLWEYVLATEDWETAADLWPVAYRQLEHVQEYVNEAGVFIDPKNFWLFIDWQADLDKQTSLQGVIIYALRHGAQLAQRLGRRSEASALDALAQRMTQAARKYLFDEQSGLFISGEANQLSWASQTWMILAEVVNPTEGAALFARLQNAPEAVMPAGPYLYHYVVEAMQSCGLNAEADALLLSYWGSMVELGATTFWEVHDPQNPWLSPYGNPLINSYCHAWSCTPTYFIRCGL